MSLRLRCGAVVLRLAAPSDDDLLVALLPDDFDHDPTFPSVPGRALRAHRETWLRDWLDAFRHPEPGSHHLVFLVEAGGDPVGLQTCEGDDFDTTHTVETTSFLVPSVRGRGLGVAMRTAVLALAFERLGAVRAISAARPDNIASRRVSERVGYHCTGRSVPLVAGAPRPIDGFELTTAEWFGSARPPVVIEGDVPWLPVPTA